MINLLEAALGYAARGDQPAESPKEKGKWAAYSKKYREKHAHKPEWKAKKAAWARAYRATHPPTAAQNARKAARANARRAAMSEEERKQRNRVRYLAQRDHRITTDKARYAADPAGGSLRRLLRNYGLTKEQYEGLMAEQKGRCAVCKIPALEAPGKKHKRLEVDHCHITGRVRGLLCLNCNTLLGRARDNPQILLAAVDYLR